MSSETNKNMLEGVRILEVADPLTEYAGLILAGLGAEVVLIEAPGGSETRARRPFVEGVTGPRRSVPFLARNLGKRSVSIDPDVGADRILLTKLASSADGVLTTTSNPLHELVAGVALPMVTVTDPRNVGRAAITAFAASGGLSSSGWPHQPPTNAPAYFGLDSAGVYAAVMLLVAIREKSSDGDAVNYSVRVDEAAVAAATPWTRPLCSYDRTTAGQGASPSRPGAGTQPVIQCRDGYVRVLTVTPGQWKAWVSLLGNPEVLCTDEWLDRGYQNANLEAMVGLASNILAERSTQELFHEGQGLGLTITPVNTLADVLADSHVYSRGLFVSLDDPDAGPVQLPRPPFRRNGASPSVLDPAPDLDADRQAFTERITSNGKEPTRPRSRQKPSGRRGVAAPLAGIRVLSLGVGAVVPESASWMALLGAEVIKVESRKNLDFLRRIGLAGTYDHNNSPTFNQLNLGVQSLTVDMGTEEGRDLVRRLVPHCDVLMENNRGDVVANWGMDYEQVRQLRPDIVYLSSQGLGDGPYGGYRTFGQNLQAFSGVTSIWAHPDDPFPVGTGLNHPDHVAGKQALAAVLAALIHRERTGEGSFLDCAQFEAAVALIGDRFLQHQLSPQGAGPIGNGSDDMAPHGCYPCMGDDAWCAIAATDDASWVRLSEVVAQDWIRDPALGRLEQRMERSSEIDTLLSNWTKARTADEVEVALRAADVPVSKVRTGPDLVADEEAHRSGFYACVAHPTAGPHWYTGLPVTDGEGRRFPVLRPPLLGEHDERVLYEIFGLDSAEVGRLAECGTIGF